MVSQVHTCNKTVNLLSRFTFIVRGKYVFPLHRLCSSPPPIAMDIELCWGCKGCPPWVVIPWLCCWINWPLDDVGMICIEGVWGCEFKCSCCGGGAEWWIGVRTIWEVPEGLTPVITWPSRFGLNTVWIILCTGTIWAPVGCPKWEWLRCVWWCPRRLFGGMATELPASWDSFGFDWLITFIPAPSELWFCCCWCCCRCPVVDKTILSLLIVWWFDDITLPIDGLVRIREDAPPPAVELTDTVIKSFLLLAAALVRGCGDRVAHWLVAPTPSPIPCSCVGCAPLFPFPLLFVCGGWLCVPVDDMIRPWCVMHRARHMDTR